MADTEFDVITDTTGEKIVDALDGLLKNVTSIQIDSGMYVPAAGSENEPVYFSDVNTPTGVFGTNPDRYFVLGCDAICSGNDSTAVGNEADTGSSVAATALGYGAYARWEGATALGMKASANSDQAVAIGHLASATNSYGVAIGYNTSATSNAVAIGPNVTVSGGDAMAIGRNATAKGNYTIVLGETASAAGNSAVAIGYNASATTDYAVALGYSASASGKYTVVLGRNASATTDYAVALGYSASASGSNSMALGYDASATAMYSTACGNNASATGMYSTACGYGAHAYSEGDVAVGEGSAVSSGYTYSTVLGFQATARGNYSTAIGANATASEAGTFVLGSSDCDNGVYAYGDYHKLSDIRDKTDIESYDDEKSLEFLTKLDTFTYRRNDRERYAIEETKVETSKDEEGNEIEKLDDNANPVTYSTINTDKRLKYGLGDYDKDAWTKGEKKGNRKHSGFSAQNIQSVMSEVFGDSDAIKLVNDNLYNRRKEGEEIPDDVESKLTVAYDSFIPIIVSAMKAQQKTIEELKAEIVELKNK